MLIIDYTSFFYYDKFRPQQESLIRQIEKATRIGKCILLQGPNGIGKTIITLSSLLPVALGKNLRIIYLCRTHTQNDRVMEELKKIYNYSSYKFSAISIRGRKDMCINDELLKEKLSIEELTEECQKLREEAEKSESDPLKRCNYYFKLLKDENYLNMSFKNVEVNKIFDIDILINECKERSICPYYYVKKLLRNMNIIVCNYQWIFHPFIKIHFLREIEESSLSNCILIIDECHNIIDLATNNNSKKLLMSNLTINSNDLSKYKNNFLNQIDAIKKSQIKDLENDSILSFILSLSEDFHKLNLEKLNREEYNRLENLIKFCINKFKHWENKILKLKEEAKKNNKFAFTELEINPNYMIKEIIEKFKFKNISDFENFLEQVKLFAEIIKILKKTKKSHLRKFVNFWISFIKRKDDNSYFICFNLKIGTDKEKERYILEIVSLDPRELIKPILFESFANLSLSGTINSELYENLTGIKLIQESKGYEKIIANSLFQKENIKVIIVEGIDSRYRKRNRLTYENYTRKIEEIVAATPQNIGIFCCSYDFLNGLKSNGLKSIVKKYNKKLFAESREFNSKKNKDMIDKFKLEAQKNGAVLLGVCRGRNAEGEDFPGDLMNAVIIAGLPLFALIPRITAKIKYYNDVFGKDKGENFAYECPAMNSANQAAGRSIRRLEDKGTIIFMDDRFKKLTYFNLISNWLKEHIEFISNKNGPIKDILSQFWNPKN